MLFLFICLAFGGIMEASSASEVIKIDGSSTVFPLTEGIAEEFQRERGVMVTVGISGTGGGFKKFCRGEIDVANASRPILKNEMEACEKSGVSFIEIPVAYDGLAVIVNRKNDFVECLSIEQLRELWKPESQGRKLTWADLDQRWPKEVIKLCGPGSDSGSFDYFTEAVVGKAKASRGDYMASEDDNVLIQFATRERNSLCYLPLSYAEENRKKIKVISVRNPATGKCVEPSYMTVQSGEYQPLSRPLFIYVNSNSARRKEVQDFVDFYIKNAGRVAKQVGYIALPGNLYALVVDRWNKREVGTVFGGELKVGITIEELLKREKK